MLGSLPNDSDLIPITERGPQTLEILIASVKNKAELHLVVLMRWGFSLEYTTQIDLYYGWVC